MTALSARPGPRRASRWVGNVGWAVLAWVVALAFFTPVLCPGASLDVYAPAPGDGRSVEVNAIPTQAE